MKKLAVALLLLPAVAFGVDVPDVDPLVELLKLIQTWGAAGPLVIGASVITIVVQALKKFAPDFQYKRLLVVFLSCVYSVILSLSGGVDIASSLVMVLVTSGGAMALYEAFKSPLNKAVGK